MLRRLPRFVLLWLTVGLVCCAPPSWAQEGIEPMSIGSSIGMRRLAPGRWGVVGVKAVNASDEDRSLTAEVYIQGFPEKRFARDVWVPAGGVRTAWLPIHVPAVLGEGPNAGRGLEIVGRVTGGATTAPQFTTLIPFVDTPLATALVTDPPPLAPVWGEVEENSAYEAVLALRATQGLQRMLASPEHERLLPPTQEGWDPVESMVLAGDHLADDSAALLAVRRWIADGGRLWLQLNRTSSETARRLLGEAFRVEVIDRVPLTRFRVDQTGTEPSSSEPEIVVEEPVELIRALVEEAEILHEVDGWPASFAIAFGKGEIIVTTLDAHGWMRLRGPEDPNSRDPQKQTKYIATTALYTLAERIFKHPPSPELPVSLQADYLTRQIGYEVPSRGLVLGILLGFCGLIAVLGIVLLRRRRLEHLAWSTSLAAVLAAAAILAMGWVRRQAVPPTAVQLQSVRIIPETGDYAATGVVARFAPEQHRASLETSPGWRIDPTMPELTGQIRAFHWSDQHRWRWRDTVLPPGVRMLSTQAAAPLRQPVRALARFGPDGLSGQLQSGEFGPAEDGLIAMPFSRPLAANLQPDGTFLATPADALAADQFIADALLDEQQRQRQTLYAAWFAGQDESRFPRQPVLMAWAERPPPGLQWPEEVRQGGTSLLTVPLTFQRTPPDQPVTIPAAALAVQAVTGNRGESLAFNNATRQWMGPLVATTATRLRFQLPAVVLPMTVQRATLAVACSIPSRQIEIFAVRDGERISIERRTSPVGEFRVTIDNADLLHPDAQGGLLFDIEVGPLTREVEEQTIANSGWRIEATRLDVSGRTLPHGGHREPKPAAGGNDTIAQ